MTAWRHSVRSFVYAPRNHKRFLDRALVDTREAFSAHVGYAELWEYPGLTPAKPVEYAYAFASTRRRGSG